MKKLLAFCALLSGAALIVAGTVFVVIYFKDAIFMRLGEADQSLIFWYLPFLFVGISGIVCGVVFGQYGLRGLRPHAYLEREEKSK